MKRSLLAALLAGFALVGGGTAQPVWTGSQGLPPNKTPSTSSPPPPATPTFEVLGSSNLEGLQLLPLESEVKVGKSVTLDIVACVDFTQGGVLPLPPNTPRYACEPSFFSGSAARWSVNGAVGGNGNVGTVKSGPGGRAVYTAPARKPGGKVAVSVEVNDPELGRVILVAHVNVVAPARWEGSVTFVEKGSDVWKMHDGFAGAGLQTAEQRHTFEVVSSREVDDANTILVLQQVASASYSNHGSMEKQVRSICQAFGPEILRHHFVYRRSFDMRGESTATIEARLNISNGRYTLSIEPRGVKLTGQDKTTDVYKEGCFQQTTDRSNSKPVTYSVEPPPLHVEGPIVPSRPDQLQGQDEGRGQLYVQPTTWTLGWTLTRTR